MRGDSPLLIRTGLAASAIGTVNVGVNLENLLGFLFPGRGRKLLHLQRGLRLFQDRQRIAALVNQAVDGDGVGWIDGFQDRGGPAR